MLQGDSAMSSASDTAGTPTGQRRMMETWIVLELCNRGSLQVRTLLACESCLMRAWM